MQCSKLCKTVHAKLLGVKTLRYYIVLCIVELCMLVVEPVFTLEQFYMLSMRKFSDQCKRCFVAHPKRPMCVFLITLGDL